MSSLSDRIRGIVGTSNPETRIPSESQIPNPESYLQALGGEWRDRCFVVERRLQAEMRHGRETVGALSQRLDRSASEAALFAADSPRPPFVFFDLETTGLSGGAGTYAFLVGCGFFSGNGAFVTRQFLLTRTTDERALLETVAAELDRAGALVTFNGKSFDTSVLETRYLFHRLEWTRNRLPHVDVLHPARRFWGAPDIGGGRLQPAQGPACSLQVLERRVVGVRRAGDVPGFEIPSRYFQFVRSGDPRPLVAVLEHNRRDLLTLAALTARLLHLSRVGPGEARDAAEALALGRTYARAGHDDRARDAFVRALEMSRAPAGAFDPVRIEALRALAVAWRRARRFDEAAACWRQLIEIRGCPPHIVREATEALAIHHEHRVRDLAEARVFALRSLDAAPHPAFARAVHYRLARIDRKIGRLLQEPLSQRLL